MDKYHKIQTVYTRDSENRYRTLIDGQFARPEFEYLKDNEWIFTEKIDGTNIRVGWDASAKEVVRGGKTDKAQIPAFLSLKLMSMLPKDTFHAFYPETSMTLYGEGYGEKIQKRGENYISDGVSFILFDININGVWLSRENVEDIAGKLGISVVPLLWRGTLERAVDMCREGFNSIVGSGLAEGIVMRPSIEILDKQGCRIISKIKYKDFAR